MSEQQLCPQCGSEIPAGAPAGLCPKCLVLAGLESRPADNPQTAATQPPPSPSAAGFLPPAIEELAARFPQLEILELLGRGGMGAVYKARQRELDRLVAVKILPPEVGRDPAFAERFTREARAMARLSHPNIVAVYDFGKLPSPPAPLPQGEGRPEPLFYFIMEYVDGVNLRQAIQTGGMDPKQALAIVPQICDALQFAHDEGVVHRDIKPENILIDKRGRVKIADFGLAKLLGQESVDHGLTMTQQVLGTLRYMAPEQMEGKKSVDHRADIYSLGVVFYELLTGELPIGRFAPPSKKVEIDVRLDEVVLRALEKEPEKRYQHASEVKTEVEQIRSGPAAASKGSVAAPVANDRGFVAALVTALAVLWVAIFISTDGRTRPILVAGSMFLGVAVFSLALLVVAANGERRRRNRIAAQVDGGAVPPPVISDQARAIGKISLCTAILGLIVPILLALIGSLLDKTLNVSDSFIILCAALATVLELLALGCGIVARCTGSGKVGLAISLVLTALTGTLLVNRMIAPSALATSQKSPAADSVQEPPATSIGDIPVPRAAVELVPVTTDERARVLAELPKQFMKGLLGDDAQSVKDLDTQIWAIDFDDGPADFWLTTREKGQETFPFRLPSRSEKETWRIPNVKAHVLIWIQPHSSVAMSRRVSGSLGVRPPGCVLGIDVDGKPVFRINYDVPVRSVEQPIPEPLWFGWASRKMTANDAEFDLQLAAHAILYVGRKAAATGMDNSCQIALIYRRATSAGENPKGTQP